MTTRRAFITGLVLAILLGSAIGPELDTMRPDQIVCADGLIVLPAGTFPAEQFGLAIKWCTR